MIEAAELLKSYVRGVRRLSGAGSVALFVPGGFGGLTSDTLVLDGDLEPVPELADAEAARRLVAKGRSRLERARAEAGGDRILSLPSSIDEGILLPLSAVGSARPWAGQSEPTWTDCTTEGRRKADQAARTATEPASAWLGLRFEPGEPVLKERLLEDGLPEALRSEGEARSWWDWLLALGGVLASHLGRVESILNDPVTGLPDRMGFQTLMAETLDKARQNSKALALLFINPDDFSLVNERFGREAGDEIVRDISRRLRSAIRSSDPLARFGGVIFAAILLDTPLEAALKVAEKIQQQASEAAYLDGAVRLGFTIGVAVFDPGDESLRHPLDLIQRADQALNSGKRQGGGQILNWSRGSQEIESGNFDRLTGIFTGNLAKDYRNMVLLWDSINAVASNRDFEGLASGAVEELYAALKPSRIGLFARSEDGELQLVRGITRRPARPGSQRWLETLTLDAEEMRLMAVAIAEGDARELTSLAPGGAAEAAPRHRYAVPLTAVGTCLGCLYLEGSRESFSFDYSDLVFLKALCSQLALALDRARLYEMDNMRQEQERRQLRAELHELRQAMQQSKLVYRSAEMGEVIASIQRVAPTDATVLLTGESGTGKELLARSLHELSTRRKRPLVIVDCGAIAASLIESELFGHEKGAFTGAHQRRPGRLVEANGGTVLLDEVAELPLEVQSKLLRFVQEKQFTTVGGSRPRSVDVRIVAATNRNLAGEVAKGRFREDLFYRLNVVRIEVPPLRQRPDDIVFLARHFLELYSLQYQKSVRRLTAEAEALLLRYDWPGNVRELQNRLMQAVILCDDETLGPQDLNLPFSGESRTAALGPTRTLEPLDRVADNQRPLPPRSDEGAAWESPPPVVTSQADVWEGLRLALGRQIEVLSGSRREPVLPLGRWLGEDLVLTAAGACGGVARQAAALLGIPETTFRRRHAKAQNASQAGLAGRSGTWEDVRRLLPRLLEASAEEGADLMLATGRLLLEEILARFPSDVRVGAGLMGVTPPTFRRRLEELARAGQAHLQSQRS